MDNQKGFMNRTEVENQIVLLGLAGSQAYRTNIEGSDTEYRGIFVPTAEYLLGTKNIEQKEGGWTIEEGTGNFPQLDTAPDTVVYNVTKYLHLASMGNPNILECLWLAEEDYLFLNDIGQLLIENRDLFLSKKVRHSYVG